MKIKLSELVVDFDVYPRTDVNGQNVTAICQALEAGDKMPPITICKKTKRVVDGVHRVRAYMRLHGPDYLIEANAKSYANDGELVLDAARLNATHGYKLTSVDRSRCALLADRLHVPMATMAKALSIPEQRLASLVVDRTAYDGKLRVPLKRTARHFAGRKLTKLQVEANDRLSGMNQIFYVNQILTLIDSELLDTSDEKLMEALAALAGRLDSLVGEKA